MKKKGFTLVELLAVIAILAILVIIALPNVMGMFNNAKKSSFETEIKNIIKYAGTEWMSKNGMGGAAAEVTYDTSADDNKISALDSRDTLKYLVKVNSLGHVTEIYVQDGTFWYTDSGTQLKPEKVDSSKIYTSADADTPLPQDCSATVTSNCWPTAAK